MLLCSAPLFVVHASGHSRLLQSFGVGGGADLEAELPTSAPTTSKAAIQPGDARVDCSFSFHYRLYTLTPNELEATNSIVKVKMTEAIVELMKEQNAPVEVQLMDSILLGSYDLNVVVFVFHANFLMRCYIFFFSSWSKGDCEPSLVAPFPTFPSCNVMKATVSSLMDAVKVEPELLQSTAVDHIQNVYMPSYNLESTTGRLAYQSPVEVETMMTIVLHGVASTMNIVESKYFLEKVQSTVGDGLLQTKNETIPLALDQVQVLHQESSSGSRLVRRRNLANSSSVEDGSSQFNEIKLVLKATCANAAVCTDETLHSSIKYSFPVYSDIILVSLLMGNSEEELGYFDDVTSVSIIDDSVEEVPVAPDVSPPEGESNPPDSDEAPMKAGKKRRISKWFWICILITISLIALTLLCICMHRCVRSENDGKMGEGEDTTRASGNSDNSKSAPAPTFSQMRDTLQEQHPQPEKTQWFSSHGKNKKKQTGKTSQEMEEDDYDNRSYGDEEFSVDPGKFRHRGRDRYEDDGYDDEYDDDYDDRQSYDDEYDDGYYDNRQNNNRSRYSSRR